MLKLQENVRDQIVDLIGKSQLPTVQGISIITALQNLPKIAEKVEAEKVEK